MDAHSISNLHDRESIHVDQGNAIGDAGDSVHYNASSVPFVPTVASAMLPADTLPLTESTGPQRRRKARRAPRKKTPNTPYASLSWNDRDDSEGELAPRGDAAARTATRNMNRRGKVSGRGMRREQPPPAPHITNQFIVAHRVSPDDSRSLEIPDPPTDSDSSDASREDSPVDTAFPSEFLEAYTEAMYGEMSRHQLISQLQLQDDELSKLRQRVNELERELKNREQQLV
jgi:hypothetical protein